jgi:hypothetical protein
MGEEATRGKRNLNNNFMTCTTHHVLLGVQNEESKMWGGACGTHWGEEKYMPSFDEEV